MWWGHFTLDARTSDSIYPGCQVPFWAEEAGNAEEKEEIIAWQNIGPQHLGPNSRPFRLSPSGSIELLVICP